MNAKRTCGLLAALIFASGTAWAQAPAAPAGAPSAAAGVAASGPKTIGVPQSRRYSTALIVMNAKAGRLDGDKLILDEREKQATIVPAAPEVEPLALPPAE